MSGPTKHPIKHFVIPDCQVRPGRPTDHLKWAGKYIADKRPDVVVCLGDFADMASLSTHDRGKRSYEGRRYRKDVDAARRGMEQLLSPLSRIGGYKPRLVLTLGNHEDRIDRAVEEDPKLEGSWSLKDLGYEKAGWQVVPYLKPIAINGVHYSHFFPSGVMGRPCTTARKIINTYHCSAVAGHQQGRDVAYAKRGNGKALTAIIAGSFYTHDEDYMPPLANASWRGCVMLHEVSNGSFDEMFVSLGFLKRRFAR